MQFMWSARSWRDGVRLAVMLWVCCALRPAFAGDPFASAGSQPDFLPVEQAYQLVPSVADGQINLDWTIAPEYFLYRDRMKLAVVADNGLPLSFVQAQDAGQQKYDEEAGHDIEVYYEKLHVALRVAEVPAGTVTLQVESQGCADAGLCYPPQKQAFRVDFRALAIEPVEVADTATPSSAAMNLPPPAEAGTGLLMALLLALAGGLMLNLMPCVFPVLSLKVFAMAAQREHDDEAHLHSWIYAAGVVLSFVLVAALMLVLRAGGAAIGWGFQLQEPLFISLLVYLFFVLGLSFSGVLHIGGSLMGVGQRLVAGSPWRSAFFTGVLAVVVASPCSVPFMGVALGYAVGQSAPLALAVFAVLGLGMALPFIVLAYWPQMLHRLPAPGPWMERLRQFLAFPLYATAVWLLWVLGQQAGQLAMVWVLAGLILLVFAGWLWRDAAAARWEKALALLVLLLALVLPQLLVVRVANPESVSATGDAEPYSEARLQQLRSEGRPVLVNLTAAWCITCLVNEKVALGRDAVRQRLHERGITYLVGDWTNRDPAITRLLQQYRRSGVPLYLYFPAAPSSDVQVLPQVLSEALLLETLQ